MESPDTDLVSGEIPIDLTGKPIDKLLYLSHQWIGKRVTISAWIHAIRFADGGKLLFIHLGTGQSGRTLQVVFRIPEDFDQKLTFQSSVKVVGYMVTSAGKGQDVEIQAESIEILGECDPDSYPLSKTRDGYSSEYVRKFSHLRSKTKTFSAVMRIRDFLATETIKFFSERGFYWIHTPILTTSDCEGAGEAFKVTVDEVPDFFRDKSAYLTVSGQLHVEPFAVSMGKVYTFGPSFRAEKSVTTRHLSEFWMLEPEMAFTDLTGILRLAEEYVKAMIRGCLDRSQDFMTEVPYDVLKLKKYLSKPFAVITYDQVIETLQKSGRTFDKSSEWGIDLGSDQEKYICDEVFSCPTFVTDYPAKIKSFYMYENVCSDDEKQTVACADLLVPGIGELMGGSQREHRYEILKKKMEIAGLDYQWYLDTRRFGSVVHSGFGIGFDRLIRFITGVNHVMDVVPYPVRYQHLSS